MLLPPPQNRIDESGDKDVLVLGICRYLSLWGSLLSHLTTTLRFLWSLCAVFRATLLSVTHTRRIESPANDVVPNSWQIFHAATSNHDDRVLLKIMSFTRNVSSHFNSIRQADASDFPQGRIRFLRRCGINACANTPLLRTTL